MALLTCARLIVLSVLHTHVCLIAPASPHPLAHRSTCLATIGTCGPWDISHKPRPSDMSWWGKDKEVLHAPPGDQSLVVMALWCYSHLLFII